MLQGNDPMAAPGQDAHKLAPDQAAGASDKDAHLTAPSAGGPLAQRHRTHIGGRRGTPTGPAWQGEHDAVDA